MPGAAGCRTLTRWAYLSQADTSLWQFTNRLRKRAAHEGNLTFGYFGRQIAVLSA